MKMRDIIQLVEDSQYPPLTLDDFRKIERFREMGLTWDIVAQRIGRPGTSGSLRVQWNRYKTGKWRNRVQQTTDANAELEREVAIEPNLHALARKKGISQAALHQRAMRLGLDQEMRSELSGHTFAQNRYLPPGVRESVEEQDDTRFDSLPPITTIKALFPQMAQAAQKQYDAWDQDEDGYDEEVGHGGICHLIADDISNILSNAGFPVWTQTATDVQHVTCVVQCRDGIVDVDVPYRLYERGSMFTWTKLPDVVFGPEDISIYVMSRYPGDIAEYVEDYEDYETY